MLYQKKVCLTVMKRDQNTWESAVDKSCGWWWSWWSLWSWSWWLLWWLWLCCLSGIGSSVTFWLEDWNDLTGTWLIITGAEWPRGRTLNPGLKVRLSEDSWWWLWWWSSPGGDPTKLAAVGGGKNESSSELCTSIPGTARFNSSMI